MTWWYLQTLPRKDGGRLFGQNKCGGRWLLDEKEKHINALELTAILFGLQSLCNETYDKHILIKSNNTTAVCGLGN